MNSIENLDSRLRVAAPDTQNIYVSTLNQSVTLDYSTSMSYSITLANSVTINISNMIVGELCEVLVELINAGSQTITWTNSPLWVTSTGVLSPVFTDTGITLQTSGKDFALFWSSDGGITLTGKILR